MMQATFDVPGVLCIKQQLELIWRYNQASNSNRTGLIMPKDLLFHQLGTILINKKKNQRIVQHREPIHMYIYIDLT